MRRTSAVLGAVLTAGAAWAQQQAPFNPYLELYDSDDWTLEITVTVRAWQEIDANGMPVTEPFKFDTAAIVFPILKRTAASLTDDRSVQGTVTLNDRETQARVEMMSDYHSGTRLGKWKLMDWAGNEVGLRVTIASTCWKTKFNEEAASQVGWPKGDWPPEAASTFEPQFYVDLKPPGEPYDMKPVKELVNRWTEGKDPKKIKPVPLAKFLAGQVAAWVQPSGNGLESNRIGQLEGIDLQGAPLTAERRRGTEFDMVCLLAAVYREAGLPARTVIGYDIGETKDDDRKRFLEKKGSESLRAWVEFAIMDERSAQLYWIPVDVVRMRKTSTRTQPLDRAWKYFGTHDELNGMIPFAFQFHPPTTVRAYGSPGFWGWLVTPKPPDSAVQALSFVAVSTPKRGGDPKEPPKREPSKRGGG